MKELIDDIKPPGSWSITWDGINEEGNPVSTGLYFILFELNGQHVQTEKAIFLK